LNEFTKEIEFAFCHVLILIKETLMMILMKVQIKLLNMVLLGLLPVVLF